MNKTVENSRQTNMRVHFAVIPSVFVNTCSIFCCLFLFCSISKLDANCATIPYKVIHQPCAINLHLHNHTIPTQINHTSLEETNGFDACKHYSCSHRSAHKMHRCPTYLCTETMHYTYQIYSPHPHHKNLHCPAMACTQIVHYTCQSYNLILTTTRTIFQLWLAD